MVLPISSDGLSNGEAAGRTFERNESFASLLGIRVLKVDASSAVLEMVVDDRHLNANRITHGGAVFTLADSALGAITHVAHGADGATSTAHIIYHRPTWFGDVLQGRAVLVHGGRSLRAYRVEVVQIPDERLVATMTGTISVRHRPTV